MAPRVFFSFSQMAFPRVKNRTLLSSRKILLSRTEQKEFRKDYKMFTFFIRVSDKKIFFLFFQYDNDESDIIYRIIHVNIVLDNREL